MNKWHKNLTKEKWQNFSFKQQILMTATECLRAKEWISKNDPQTAKDNFERALELLDLTISVNIGSRNLKKLLILREEMGIAYLYSDNPILAQRIYEKLLSLSNK